MLLIVISGALIPAGRFNEITERIIKEKC